MSEREVWIVAAARTAIGTFGGSLKDLPLGELATTALKGAIERSGVTAQQIEHVVMGNVIPTEPKDAYLSRVAAIGPVSPRKRPPSTSIGCADPGCRRSSRRPRPFCSAMPISPSARGPSP